MLRFLTPIFWLLTVIFTASWIALQFEPTHDTFYNYLFGATYSIIFLLAGSVLLVRVWQWRNDRNPDTTSFILLAIGILFWGVGQMGWGYYNIFLGVEIPFLSIPDVFYSASLFLMNIAFIGMLIHPTRQRPVHSIFHIVFLLAMTVASIVVGYLVISVPEESLFVITAYFNVTAFLLPFLITLNISRERHAELRSFFTISLFASILFGMANVLFNLRISLDTYWVGDITDGLFFAAATGLLYAGMHYLPKKIEHTIAYQKSRLRIDILFPSAIVLVGVLLAMQLGQTAYLSQLNEVSTRTEAQGNQVSSLIAQQFGQQATHLLVMESVLETRLEDSPTPTEIPIATEPVVSLNGMTEADFRDFVQVFAEEATGNQFFLLAPNGSLQFYADGTEAPDEARRVAIIDTLPDGIVTEARATDAIIFTSPRLSLDGTPIMFVLKRVDGFNNQFLGVAGITIPLPEMFAVLAPVLHSEEFITSVQSEEYEIANDGSVFRDITLAERRLEVELQDQIQFEQAIAYDSLNWSVVTAPTDLYARSAYVDALSRGFTTLLIALMIAVMIYLVTANQEKLRQEVAEKTHSLAQRLEELRLSRFYLDHVSDAVIAFNAKGSAVYANHAAQLYFGAAKKLLGTKSKKIFINAKGEYNVANTVERQITALEPWENEFSVKKAQVGTRDLIANIVPLVSEEKHPLGALLIARDITDRKDVERAKNQFVSLVAHQLRGPMTHMRWAMEELSTQSRLPKNTRDLVQELQRMVINESNLVTDLLNVSRIERGVLKVNIKAVPLSNLVHDSIEPLSQLADEKKISIDAKDVPKLQVQIDPEKAVEAIRNIVDNAIKYSPKSTEITIEAQDTKQDTVTIAISDQGKGIPDDIIDHIFEIKTSETGSSTGAGLGLYLTKKFVEAMNGSIEVKSSKSGTTFLVKFKKAKPTTKKS